MEAVQPPLFLRFINLLMNDAVFLLDEALSNMAQLRQMLQARYFYKYYIILCNIIFCESKHFIFQCSIFNPKGKRRVE